MCKCNNYNSCKDIQITFKHRRRNECEDGGAKWIYLIIIAKKGLTKPLHNFKWWG